MPLLLKICFFIAYFAPAGVGKGNIAKTAQLYLEIEDFNFTIEPHSFQFFGLKAVEICGERVVSAIQDLQILTFVAILLLITSKRLQPIYIKAFIVF